MEYLTFPPGIPSLEYGFIRITEIRDPAEIPCMQEYCTSKPAIMLDPVGITTTNSYFVLPVTKEKNPGTH